MALPRGPCVSPPRYSIHRVTADKRYSDYLARQAFGDSNTPSGPSSHASRIAGQSKSQSTRTAGVYKEPELASRISSCTRILKAPLILLAARALSEPWRLADPLQSRSDDGMLQAAASAAWGAVMDVVICLRSLGLGKYEAAFRELPSAPIKPRSSASSATVPGLSDNFSTSSQSGGARGRE